MMEGRIDGDGRLRDLADKASRTRLTDRLRLEPIGPGQAEDLWRLHRDDAVAVWHGGRWTMAAAHRNAARMGQGWQTDGVHKWMAYDRGSGDLVGRGGLSRMQADGDTTGRIQAALPGEGWAQDRLEVGWTVRSGLWGHGYATEIGRAGLALAFEELGAEVVVAFSERHNRRSRAVMERLGMRHVGEFVDRGLVEGLDGVHDGAPFALYALGRSEVSGSWSNFRCAALTTCSSSGDTRPLNGSSRRPSAEPRRR
jgi:RimJ/RimL family protein N-acetyltransferase